ncbi:MAG: Mur ligase family protein [Candidatus Rokuibacteriota bacterium]
MKWIALPSLFFWARLVLRCRRPCIVGITGTGGKTTTKEMIATVLMHPEARAVVGVVGKSPRNMNDNIGLPFAVLGHEDFDYDTLVTGRQWLAQLCTLPFRALARATRARFPRILVLEYAASAPGDVPRLARLAPPTIAVVTAVGPGHLERFKTVERVAREKSALVRRVRPSGLVVLGADNPYASGMDRETQARVIKVPGRGRELSKGIARVVARELGLTDDLIARALHEFQGPRARSQMRRLGSLTVIDDSFNGNPLSMELGLDTLAETATPGTHAPCRHPGDDDRARRGERPVPRGDRSLRAGAGRRRDRRGRAGATLPAGPLVRGQRRVRGAPRVSRRAGGLSPRQGVAFYSSAPGGARAGADRRGASMSSSATPARETPGTRSPAMTLLKRNGMTMKPRGHREA